MKPLEGLLVVAIEQALAAPLCTSRLADAGARVIKIERKEGDFARGYDQAAKGSSSYFTWTNQGKESIVLNFRESDDAAVLENLISQADVFIQNLVPGAMDRAGFGSERLRKDYPKLITVDISGYGESETVKHLKAYDFLIQAESGLTGISGGENEMGRIGVSICDIGAGMTAHAAVLEALIRRSRTGQGSALAISLFDVAADWMSVPLIHQEYGQGAPKRVGLKHPSMAPYGAFPSSDYALTLVSVQNEREWARFCEIVLGDSNIAIDHRFSSNNLRVQNREALEQLITSITQVLTQDVLKQRLATADIAFGAVNSVEDLAKHPALVRRSVRNESGDEVSIPRLPIRWLEDENTAVNEQQAPKLGAHTQKIKHEFKCELEA
ncbi:CaiB/BaiF CoA transferase family protein [Acinetobacter sp. MB5]|uniref:CaiB/BaiF CoA transferase family protein n=1 Tax=Acinetobacter sp. MB5 TaxID=2069438 RepID=UPI000DD0C22B|nr:CaiB/BaiF CoA-transferase family protein [Acinetobacter sp. MB5]